MIDHEYTIIMISNNNETKRRYLITMHVYRTVDIDGWAVLLLLLYYSMMERREKKRRRVGGSRGCVRLVVKKKTQNHVRPIVYLTGFQYLFTEN